jgi:hypothetical protein
MAQTNYMKEFVSKQGYYFVPYDEHSYAMYEDEKTYKALGLIHPPYSHKLWKLGFHGYIKKEDIWYYEKVDDSFHTFRINGEVEREYTTTLSGLIVTPPEFKGYKFRDHLKELIKKHGFGTIKCERVDG